MQRRQDTSSVSPEADQIRAVYTTSTKPKPPALASLQAKNELTMSGATLLDVREPSPAHTPGTSTPALTGTHTPATLLGSRNPSSTSLNREFKKEKDNYYGSAITQGMDDEHDAKKLVRKIDLRLVPGLALLYLLMFLCRQNIGNAKTFGMKETLGMSNSEYQWALTAFFFTYSFFDIPANMLLKILKPHRWLPLITVISGVITTLMGITASAGGLIAARTVLGMAECGLFPGVAYTITCWYIKKEAQFRQALFFCAASMAGAFAGLLAVALNKMDGVGGQEGWRWILIIEGILTVVLSVPGFWYIVPPPEECTFLSESEKHFHKRRMLADQYGTTDESTLQKKMAQQNEIHPSKRSIFSAVFKDWKIYMHIMVFLGITCPLYSVSLCLPSIVMQLDYTAEMANVLTIPVYISACIISLITAYLSDRVGKRVRFISFGYFLMLVGFLIAACRPADKPAVAYAGLFIASCGIYPAFPGMVTWFANNTAPVHKRSIAMALHIGTGSLGGAMGANFYAPHTGPRYILGHCLNIMFVTLGGISMLTLGAYYKKVNAKREQEREKIRKRVRDELKEKGVGEIDVWTEKKIREISEEEIGRLGDASVWFTYML